LAPVVKNEELVGIISIHDLLDYTIKPQVRETVGERSGEKLNLWMIKIKDTMKNNPIIVSPEITLLEAEKKCMKTNIIV
jgi:CBS domain-containing protein